MICHRITINGKTCQPFATNLVGSIAVGFAADNILEHNSAYKVKMFYIHYLVGNYIVGKRKHYVEVKATPLTVLVSLALLDDCPTANILIEDIAGE